MTEAARLVLVSMHRDLSRRTVARPGPFGALDRLAHRTERDVGGVQVSTEAARRVAEASGLRPVVITPFDGWWVLPLLAAAVAKLIDRRWPVRAASWHRRWHRVLVSRSLERWRRAHPEESVIWYAQDPSAAALALAARRSGERVVVACHYSGGSEAAELELRGVLPPGHPLAERIRRAERSVLHRVDAVVVVSGAALVDLEAEVGELGERVRVVPNAVDGRLLAAGAAAPDRPEPPRDLVTVGRVSEEKGHGEFLAMLAAARRRGRQLTATVVGGGAQLPAIIELARASGVADLVEFPGPTDDVAPVLGRHRLYVHMSRAETFGLAVAEAMALAVPVAVVPVGGLAELVPDGEVGRWLPAGDPEGAASVVLGMIDGDDLAGMGAAGHRRVASRYSEAAVGSQLLDVWLGHPAEVPA